MSSILEQMASRFDTYASDQIAMKKRRHTIVDKQFCDIRAEVWRQAAADLRELSGAGMVSDTQEQRSAA